MTRWRVTDALDGSSEDVEAGGRTLDGPRGGRAVLLIRDEPPRQVLVRRSERPTTAALGVEVVVDGWRFELDVDDAARAALRERATRDREAAETDGPLRIRAVIPGRVVSLAVSPGDDVSAGEPLLVIEAMKMQNELRAPREGRIEQVAIHAGSTVERGDLLLVLG